jgi:hypothetical protein
MIRGTMVKSVNSSQRATPSRPSCTAPTLQTKMQLAIEPRSRHTSHQTPCCIMHRLVWRG